MQKPDSTQSENESQPQTRIQGQTLDLNLSRLSIGSLTNKILAINPSLGVTEIIAIIRQCTTSKSVPFGSGVDDQGFSQISEQVDEGRALELARATVQKTVLKNH